MFKWLLKKYYKQSPECYCGWAMKPFERYTDRDQWKCIWKNFGKRLIMVMVKYIGGKEEPYVFHYSIVLNLILNILEIKF